MNTKPLRLLFEAIHHQKHSFEEFLNLDVSAHYEQVRWRKRDIYKPSKTLRAIHSFLNSFVFEFLTTNDAVSFAYRKGATIRDAVVPHAHSRAFYQTDLKKFFDSITDEMVRASVADAVTPVSDLPEYLNRIVELTTIDGKLPIGFATSPLLSNACLRHFDDQLQEECASRTWIYTRYADDITISASSLALIQGAEDSVKKILADALGEGFRINGSKSRLTTIGRNVKILGLVVLPNGRVTIDKEIRHSVEAQLYLYTVDRQRLEDFYKGELEQGLERLSGYISYIHNADPSYLSKLRRKYGSTVVDSFLHRSAQ